MRLARPKPPGRSLDPAGNRGARGMIAAVASKGAAAQDPAYRPAPADLSSPSEPSGRADTARPAQPSRGMRDTLPRDCFCHTSSSIQGGEIPGRTPLRLRLPPIHHCLKWRHREFRRESSSASGVRVESGSPPTARRTREGLVVRYAPALSLMRSERH